jgi:hypothetical protein
MREGDVFRGPSKNKSQDQLNSVDSLNLTDEGLLLGRQDGGLACRRPPNTITLA